MKLPNFIMSVENTKIKRPNALKKFEGYCRCSWRRWKRKNWPIEEQRQLSRRPTHYSHEAHRRRNNDNAGCHIEWPALAHCYQSLILNYRLNQYRKDNVFFHDHERNIDYHCVSSIASFNINNDVAYGSCHVISLWRNIICYARRVITMWPKCLRRCGCSTAFDDIFW